MNHEMASSGSTSHYENEDSGLAQNNSHSENITTPKKAKRYTKSRPSPVGRIIEDLSAQAGSFAGMIASDVRS